MVCHVVLLKPRPDLTAADRQAFVDAFAHAVRGCETVRGVRTGRRVTHGAGYETSVPDTADYIAMIDFEDVAGLQAYLRHPAHAQIAAKFGEALSSAFVYDFEIRPLGDLA